MKLPPSNIEAEQSVLGSILLDKDAIIKVAEIINVEDFYQEGHQKIYKTMLDLSRRDVVCDIVTVSENMEELDSVGGIGYLSDLASAVPSTANVEQYAKIVKEKSILRQLIRESDKIIKQSYEATYAQEVLDQAERAILSISQDRGGEFTPIDTLLSPTFERIEHLSKNKGFPGLSTGFSDMDRITSGLQPSDFIVVAARPSMGKTSLCLNIAQHIASQGTPVAIFSLEMSKEQLVQRLLSAEAMIPGQRLKTGDMETDDWPKLVSAMGKLNIPIFIDDSPTLTVMDIRARTRRLAQKHGIGLVIIDYLQLISGHGESRQQQITEISRSLKALARETNCPVIALSQLSRAVEQRQDKHPILADLRESGAIEQDADLVAFIYRDEYYNPDSEKAGTAEVIIAKQRNGPTGKVELAFLKEYTLFCNLEIM